jgi:hypothetical protein
MLSGRDATAAMLKVLALFINRSGADQKIAAEDGPRNQA